MQPTCVGDPSTLQGVGCPATPPYDTARGKGSVSILVRVGGSLPHGGGVVGVMASVVWPRTSSSMTGWGGMNVTLAWGGFWACRWPGGGSSARTSWPA